MPLVEEGWINKNTDIISNIAQQYLVELFEKNNLPLNIDKNPTLNKIGISFSIF